jgi:hypothetical protein
MVRSSNRPGELNVYSDCLCNGWSGVRVGRDSSAYILTVCNGWSEVRIGRESSACIVTVYLMDGQEFECVGIAQCV